MEIHLLLDDFHKSRNISQWLPHLVAEPALIADILGVLQRQEKYPYSEYGSWLLMHVVKKHKNLLLPHVEKMIDLLFITENSSVRRNVMSILHQMPYTDYREGEVLELLISILMDKANPVAVLVHSIYMLIPISRKYPELRQEIQSIFSLYNGSETPALRVAFRRFSNLK